MTPSSNTIEVLSAPSVLGLRLSGVERLAAALLDQGLATTLSRHAVVPVATLNEKYSGIRDPDTNCLNPQLLRDFSLRLMEAVIASRQKDRFPLVLGGDCSILLGIMPALKTIGTYGLFFIDAHADFYQPEKSVTGEAADMDLAMVTGRGPDLLTDINGLKPYTEDRHVIHIGQRDWIETQQYGSQDIRETAVKCFSLPAIREQGIETITEQAVQYAQSLHTAGFWLHFDTDSLSDDINPAVDYRLPGGLSKAEAVHLIRELLQTKRIAGLSVTCFNPDLDKDQNIARMLKDLLIEAFH